MAVNEALGFLSGVKIVGTDYRLAPYEMAVRADNICAIFWQVPFPQTRREHNTSPSPIEAKNRAVIQK